MKKELIVVYDTEKELHGLAVADPNKRLPNGNYEILTILIGDYADEIYKVLTDGTARKKYKRRGINEAITSAFKKVVGRAVSKQN